MAEFKNWPEGYQIKIEEILGAPIGPGEMRITLGTYDTVDEAKLTLKKLRLMQKQLRHVKKESNQDMKEIRAAYQLEGEKIADSGTFTGLFFGKRAAGRDRQRKRADLSQKQKSALEPYENVKDTIDTLILAMEGTKLDIETFIMESDRK